MPDLDADYRALREEVGAVRLPRDFVRVSGSDALDFLDGQLSQDVKALATGASALSLLLQPQGKVVALVRVTRSADDEFVLDTDAGWGDAVVERLTRFKLRVKCDIEPTDGHCIALRGPGLAGRWDVEVGTYAAQLDWPGLTAIDLIGPDPSLPDFASECGLEAYEAVRVEAGVPVTGRELDERTIPHEAGPWLIEKTVSFTKGCYTGQELVARIDSRGGNVPRRLRGLIVAGSVTPSAGAVVHFDGKDSGTVTSAARSPALGPVALAYVKRDVPVPGDVTLAWDGGEAAAQLQELPLLG